MTLHRFVLGACLIAAAGARAQSDRPIRVLNLHITPVATCSVEEQPARWHDVSDPWLFATLPTAWMGQQELAAANLSPLIAVVFGAGRPRLLVGGMPTAAASRLTLRYSGPRTGWTLRWPYCAPSEG